MKEAKNKREKNFIHHLNWMLNQRKKSVSCQHWRMEEEFSSSWRRKKAHALQSFFGTFSSTDRGIWCCSATLPSHFDWWPPSQQQILAFETMQYSPLQAGSQGNIVPSLQKQEVLTHGTQVLLEESKLWRREEVEK